MTYDEFKAELEKTPDLLTDITEKHESDFLKHLTEKKGKIVTSTDDYARDRAAAIGEGSKKAHEAWEAKIEELTGLKKTQGEKGLDFYDRVKKDLKFQATQTDDTPEGRADNAAIKALQKQLEDMQKANTEKDKAFFVSKVKTDVEASIRGLKFSVPPHIKDDATKAAYQRDLVAEKTALFNSLYTAEARTDGSIQYKDKSGTVLVDNSGEPLTVEAVFAKNHAHLLTPTGNNQGGAGSNDAGGNGNADYLGKNREEIRAKLAEKGLASGTTAWKEALKKALVAAGLPME